jgi:hypothetical protein
MTCQVPTFGSGAGKTGLNVTNGLSPYTRYCGGFNSDTSYANKTKIIQHDKHLTVNILGDQWTAVKDIGYRI